MDHHQFDSLTRQLANRTGSRRGILKAITASAASTGLGVIGLREAAAKKKKKQKKCKKPKVKCGKKCCSPPVQTLPVQTFRFAANDMSGANEVPVNSGDPTGSGSAQFTIQGTTICGTFQFANGTFDSTVNGTHIHAGAPGVDGGIVVDFSPAVLNQQTCVPCPGTTCSNIISNPAAFYANIHTVKFPSGAVRAQLQAVPS
jgi:hypothetical protein